MTAQESLDCLPEPSIDDLMRRVKHRDLLAFERLYCLMRPVIMCQVIAGGWQKSAADDIVQEVFLRVWENPDRFDSQRSAIAYLFGISRNVMRERRKLAGTTVTLTDKSLPEPAIEHDPSAEMERCEVRHILSLARLQLSENQAVAVQMAYDQDLRPREIAKRLGCTERAIHLRLIAGRRRLRQLLHRQLIQAILPISIFGRLNRCLAWAMSKAACRYAGMGMAVLVMLAPFHLDPSSDGRHDRKPNAFAPISRLSGGGESSSSPAAGVELQAKSITK